MSATLQNGPEKETSPGCEYISLHLQLHHIAQVFHAEGAEETLPHLPLSRHTLTLQEMVAFNDGFCVCTITCMYYLAIYGHLRQNFNSKIPFLRPTFQFRQIIFKLTEYNIDHIHYTNTYMCCPVMPHTRTK